MRRLPILEKWKRYGAATTILFVVLLVSASSAPAAVSSVPVVIANGWSASDVGTAAPLAARLSGRVLFTGKDALGNHSIEALKKLKPGTVIILGGTRAVTTAVEKQINDALAEAKIERLAGSNRIETAAQAALYAVPSNSSSLPSSPNATDYQSLEKKLDRLQARIAILEASGLWGNGTQQVKAECLRNHYHTRSYNGGNFGEHTHRIPSHSHDGYGFLLPSTHAADWRFEYFDQTSTAQFGYTTGCP